MNELVLEHHGIKGQKWGVRRFQNADGSLTSDGRKRYGTGNAVANGDNRIKQALTSDTAKKLGKAALVAGSVAAAGYLYANNKGAVDAAVSAMAERTVSELRGVKQVTTALGKTYMQKVAKDSLEASAKFGKDVGKSILDGARAGVVAAPGKVVKVAAEGAALMAAKKLLETVSGNDAVSSTTQAYNAYNKKNKVGRVPNSLRATSKNGNEDDDDD